MADRAVVRAENCLWTMAFTTGEVSLIMGRIGPFNTNCLYRVATIIPKKLARLVGRLATVHQRFTDTHTNG